MSFILILAFLFAIGSLIGWVLELFFRRFFDKANKERKWINPGFLNGPYLPIYGISLIMFYLLAQLEEYVHIDNDVIRKLILFFIMAACITIFEFFYRNDIHCKAKNRAMGLHRTTRKHQGRYLSAIQLLLDGVKRYILFFDRPIYTRSTLMAFAKPRIFLLYRSILRSICS